jgi:hypothetical protein
MIRLLLVVAFLLSPCTAQDGTMLSGFVFRVNDPATGTGSGHSISFGDVQPEQFCPGRTSSPNPYRRNATIRGTLGALSNSTVAACQGNTDLYVSGARVYLHGIGVKTVTDRCPACCNDVTHLDNFTTDTSCTGIGDLTATPVLTIRLY